jgi:type IV pilus assembly protein PilV
MENQHRHYKAFQSDAEGFTLIEVLIAMVLLSIALLGMAGLITGIMTGNAHSNRLTTGTTLAQEKMEDIRRAGYAGVSAGTESSLTGYPLFQRTTGVAANSPAAGMKTVTVTVSWDSGAKSVALTTLLTE